MLSVSSKRRVKSSLSTIVCGVELKLMLHVSHVFRSSAFLLKMFRSRVAERFSDLQNILFVCGSFKFPIHHRLQIKIMFYSFEWLIIENKIRKALNMNDWIGWLVEIQTYVGKISTNFSEISTNTLNLTDNVFINTI